VVRRVLERHLRAAAKKSPVVTIAGPRQSGKTTLARAVFPRKAYVSLEPPDIRELARTDPRGFLADYPDGAIFDEIQRAPEILSYLQGLVDEDPRPGRFVLTGSQNLMMHRAVSQSLAGRTAMVTLLPLARDEVTRFPRHPSELFETLLTGGYPAIFDRASSPGSWLSDYVATYVERDVRELLEVTDLGAFQRFLRLAAGRSGQIVNASSLASDVGLSHNTVTAWIGVLEASYLVARLPAYHRNVGKRLVKAPKLVFLDSGLLSWLLGIRTTEQLRHHPLRGAVFESWVTSEILKARAHRRFAPDVSYYRDQHGTEVDAVVETDEEAVLVEAKSGETLSGDFVAALERVAPLVAVAAAPRTALRRVVYGGAAAHSRNGTRFVPWSKIQDVSWT
jgi:predicted AAA+ superfamily ATPase